MVPAFWTCRPPTSAPPAAARRTRAAGPRARSAPGHGGADADAVRRLRISPQPGDPGDVEHGPPEPLPRRRGIEVGAARKDGRRVAGKERHGFVERRGAEVVRHRRVIPGRRPALPFATLKPG